MTRKKLTSVLLAFVMAVTFMGFHAAANENVLYVSPDGSDSADGSLTAPLATLQGAKERAKTMRGSVTVYFREGNYTITEPVIFTGDDKADVTYCSYGNETAVFTAGIPFTGFEESEANGIRAFKKQVGSASFNVLFNGETTLQRPRFPENGYLYVKDTSDSDIINPEQSEAFHHGYRAMYVDTDAVPQFKNSEDVVIRILHYWKDEMVTVRSYDTSGRMEFSRPTSMQIQKNDRFFFENVFEALNESGEWYLDKPTGTLWYIPFENETAGELTLWGSDTETMLQLDGINGVTFERIVFRGNGFRIPRGNTERDLSSQAAYDATACISAENTRDVQFKNCEFRDIAACALYFGVNVQNAAVENCFFENIGAQAVFIRGQNVPADDENVTKNIRIINNSIRGYGRVFFNAVGVLIIHANTVEVLHNEIRDGYYTAISCGWVWGYGYNVTYNNTISDNLIYNIGQGWLSDMGGIYMLGVQPGTVLKGNVIHNVAADPGQGGYGGWGVYLDEGSSQMTVENNLVFACGSDSYHLHYGADNTVRNNIFALSADSQIRVVSRYENHKTADFTNNIILTAGSAPVFSHVAAKDALTAENNLLWDITRGDVLVTNESDVNKAMSLQTAQRKHFLGENTVDDPLFADARNFDFTLAENSPAFEMGFDPWDYSEAGTLAGSEIGLGRSGGLTAYNDYAVWQAPNGNKELLPVINRMFNGIYSILLKISKFLKTLFAA